LYLFRNLPPRTILNISRPSLVDDGRTVPNSAPHLDAGYAKRPDSSEIARHEKNNVSSDPGGYVVTSSVEEADAQPDRWCAGMLEQVEHMFDTGKPL